MKQYFKILSVLPATIGLCLFFTTPKNLAAVQVNEKAPNATWAKPDLEDLPSGIWPTFVTTTEKIERTGATRPIRQGARGVLQRCEGEFLVIDFGRDGIHRIPPQKTDFFEQAIALLKGDQTKPYPNFTAQVGNKLMHFDENRVPRHIALREIADLDNFLVLLLPKYDPELEIPLQELSNLYKEFTNGISSAQAVVSTPARTYYDFAYTVGFGIPMIKPHLSAGYYKTLGFRTNEKPTLLALDAEGKIVFEKTIGADTLLDTFLEATSALGYDWGTDSKRNRSRSASWLSN